MLAIMIFDCMNVLLEKFLVRKMGLNLAIPLGILQREPWLPNILMAFTN